MDVCCGTADPALLLAEKADSETEIVAVDFSETMITVARGKMEVKRRADRISLILTNVSELPFRDGYFETVGITFAFRNVTFRNPKQSRCLAEIHRVLAPEGRFVIVETSQPPVVLAAVGLPPVHETLVGSPGQYDLGPSGRLALPIPLGSEVCAARGSAAPTGRRQI